MEQRTAIAACLSNGEWVFHGNVYTTLDNVWAELRRFFSESKTRLVCRMANDNENAYWLRHRDSNARS